MAVQRKTTCYLCHGTGLYSWLSDDCQNAGESYCECIAGTMRAEEDARLDAIENYALDLLDEQIAYNDGLESRYVRGAI